MEDKGWGREAEANRLMDELRAAVDAARAEAGLVCGSCGAADPGEQSGRRTCCGEPVTQRYAGILKAVRS